MKQIPTGTELARPFLPAKDFAVSKNFYEALGFEKLHDEECRHLQGRFQQFYPSELLQKRVG
jgi:hypothetical protein